MFYENYKGKLDVVVCVCRLWSRVHSLAHLSSCIKFVSGTMRDVATLYNFFDYVYCKASRVKDDSSFLRALFSLGKRDYS